MLFSIIVPVYNSERFIRDCLNSILAQNYDDFEVIIIDDGSTDNTSSILELYSHKDSRIKIYRFENAGVSISRRRGISLAQGEYILFVDSDDTISPELLKEISSAITNFDHPDIIRHQCNLVEDAPYKNHNRYNFVEKLNTNLSGMEALKLWSTTGKKYAVYWLFAFRRTIFSNVLFLPDLRCYEDVALIPLLIATSKKIVTINYVGYNYTCNNAMSLTNIKDKSAERARAIDFVKAYNYAIENFRKIENVSVADLAFFVEDYNKRLKGKFNSLDEDLKKELFTLFNI